MLSSRSKWTYIIIAYMCLFLMFTVAIITLNSIVRLLTFVLALLIFYGATGKKIKSAVLLTVAVLPNTELLSGSFAGLSILRIIFVLCLLMIMMRYITAQKKDKILVSSWFYIIWIIYIIFNLLFINGGFSFRNVLSIFGMMFISIALQVMICDDNATTEKFILMIFVGFSFIVIVACIELLLGRTFFYSLWTGTERYRYGIMRVGSTVADPNNVCFYLVPFYFWINTEAVKRTIPSYYRKIFRILTLIIILLTLSRAGLVSLLLGLLFCFLGKRKAVLLITLPAFGIIFLNIFEMLMKSAVESTNFRNLIAEQCLLLWSKNKLFGVGITNVMASLGYSSSTLNTMNTFIFMLTGLGLIGLFMYVLYWLFMIKENIWMWAVNKRIKEEQLNILACVFTAVVMAYTLDTFYMMLMWIMPAMLLAVSRKRKIGEQ